MWMTASDTRLDRHCPNFTFGGMSQHFPNQQGNYGTQFSVISRVQRSVHRTWHMETVNKILHLWVVKVMSHRGEASMKHDRKVCDFCSIITPLD